MCQRGYVKIKEKFNGEVLGVRNYLRLILHGSCKWHRPIPSLTDLTKGLFYLYGSIYVRHKMITRTIEM